MANNRKDIIKHWQQNPKVNALLPKNFNTLTSVQKCFVLLETIRGNLDAKDSALVLDGKDYKQLVNYHLQLLFAQAKIANAKGKSYQKINDVLESAIIAASRCLSKDDIAALEKHLVLQAQY